MAVIYTELPNKLIDLSIGVQALYFWTRSKIDSAVLVDSADKSRVISLPAPRIDGTHVVFNWKSERVQIADVTPEIRITFKGEPLRVLKSSWIGQKSDIYDPRASKLRWLECREKDADNEWQRFFLLLDKHTNSNFLFSVLSQEEEARRQEALDLVSGYISKRMMEIAGVRCFPTNTLRHGAVAEISDLIECLITKAYGNDVDMAIEGFDRFAAGWLRQTCDISPEYRNFSACDADSAFVFFFGQFALAVLEHARDRSDRRWREREAYWRRLLNVFVRMQTLFLERWTPEKDPKCFRLYDGTSCPLTSGRVDAVRKVYHVLNDEHALVDQLTRNLALVKVGSDQCNDACCFDD
ncbi:MAG: hypothetical protein H6819_05710 [Phycisphaerales bacterium]|nr:hypothetical protein [Phycisphaerales bacterium]MCB9854723.1 hypothetical protein [Phycisphaerales bacterium]